MHLVQLPALHRTAPGATLCARTPLELCQARCRDAAVSERAAAKELLSRRRLGPRVPQAAAAGLAPLAASPGQVLRHQTVRLWRSSFPEPLRQRQGGTRPCGA